jgi:alpha-tubulin suppressor-like RCC1 family protein
LRLAAPPRLAALTLAGLALAGLCLSACAARRPVGAAPEPAALVDLTSGLEHLCALRQRRVSCWGAAQRGVSQSALEGLEGVTALAAGAHHTCALHQGRVSCWGEDTVGQLGRGQAVGWGPEPVEVKLPGAAVAVAASNNLSCALLERGDLWCWGQVDSFHPIKGLQVSFSQASPTRLGGPGAVALAIAGDPCVLTGGGEVSCWPGGAPAANPVRQAQPPTLLARLVGGAQLCGLSPRAELLCLEAGTWRAQGQGVASFVNTSSQCRLGLQGQLACQGGVEVKSPGPLRRVAVGHGYVCAIDPQGRLECWGSTPW